MSVQAIGVVIPARDEEKRLGACLDALDVAIGRVAVPVEVVVVLDRCTDSSAAVVAARPWATTISATAGNVGTARNLGVEAVLQRLLGWSLDDIWIANTDADSTVPEGWLARQLALEAEGWDAVVGTVAVDDWSEHHSSVSTRWAAGYQPVEHHAHVHGANLGLRASVYVAVGGWPSLPAHEDVELVKRLSGHRVVSTATLPVVTSARRDPRCLAGFGDTMNSLAG